MNDSPEFKVTDITGMIAKALAVKPKATVNLPTGGEIHDCTFKDVTFADCTGQLVVISNCTFIGVEFSALDFDGVWFIDCEFDGCTFEESLLVKCSFKNCTLYHTKFEACNLQSTFLRNTKFFHAEFIECELQQMTTHSCTMSNVSFQDSNLIDSDYNDVWWHRMTLDSDCHTVGLKILGDTMPRIQTSKSGQGGPALSPILTLSGIGHGVIITPNKMMFDYITQSHEDWKTKGFAAGTDPIKATTLMWDIYRDTLLTLCENQRSLVLSYTDNV